MTKISLEIDFTLEPEFFEDILDSAGFAIGYWAESASIETVDEHNDEIIYRVQEEDGEEFVITRGNMETTICNIVTDKYADVNQVLKNDLILLCLGDDDIDIDATAADWLVQLSCFHEVRYA